MLTIFGGKGFIGEQYVASFYDAAIGNIASVNAYDDYEAHSDDVLYLIQPYRYVEREGDSNLTVLTRVLDSWRRGRYKGLFNLVSSAKVYGDHDRYADEETVCEPVGFYSHIRYCAERLLISYCAAYGLKYRILRVSNAVGAKATGTPQKNVLPYLLRKLAAGETIEVQGDGSFYRDYIHNEDCARALELAMTFGEANSIYNIGNGVTERFIDILGYAQHAMNSGRIVFVPQKVAPLSFSMNTAKLRGLGYVPKYTGERLYEALLPK